jgi:hypothetical protein
MDAVNIISILWIIGTIGCCIGGCHRSRVLGRKIRALEDKLEKIAHPQIVYSTPISTNTYATAPAPPPMYSPPHMPV